MQSRDVQRGVYLIMALFLLQPMVIGGWFAFIPLVKETLGLTKADLAIALLGMPVAVLITLQVAGRAVSRIGVRRTMLLAFPAQALTALGPLAATGQGTLFLALAGFGASVAFMEIALNVYAGRIEKKAARHVMNRCHGFWALGLMAGSFAAVQAASLTGPLTVMAAIAVASAGLGMWAARALPPVGQDGAGEAAPRRRVAEIPAALLPVGLFMLLFTLVEGAMADWSAVYLSERQSIDVTDAGFAVAVFSGFMAAGRFSGDFLKGRFGAVALARGSAALAMAGLLILVMPLPVAAAFVGFACVGLGVAAGYPLGVSAVAAIDDTHEAANVALMSTCALAGFLVGPPLIGFLAEAYGIRTGFAALIPAVLLCAGLAGALRPRESPPVTL